MYHKLGYTSVDQAKMFVTTGVVMAILQGSVVRRLPSQYVKPSAVFGLYLIIPAFILVGLANDSKLLYAGMILFAICKLILLDETIQICNTEHMVYTSFQRQHLWWRVWQHSFPSMENMIKRELYLVYSARSVP